jgi:aryl-alcohol dehydrogenase-like predicted oxidoreductase
VARPCATPEGTAAYRDRFSERLPAEHFKTLDGLSVSSIGLGTYLGDSTDEADAAYTEAIRRALVMGCNLIDAAINYRCQRSERTIGRALKEAMEAGEISRQEVVVATKGGFVPFDGSVPEEPGSYFSETYVATGIVGPADLVAGCHVMTAGYIADQIERSRRNLELECIDLYYLHNPETQLSAVDWGTFEERLREAFSALEEAVSEGKICRYGAATWNGFRLDPEQTEHLSLEAMVSIAREVGGEDHHFRAVQLPYNLAMPEAFFNTTQRIEGQEVSLVEAAESFGISVVASASLLQAKLTTGLPPALAEVLAGLETDAQRAIQFVRSTPGVGVALVGMSSVSHVEENLSTAAVAPLSSGQFHETFQH